MAYDSGRGRTVLFGGTGAGADTWEWDGENWTQMADLGPPARSDAAMAYDTHRNQTALFGGSNGMADTWGWMGETGHSWRMEGHGRGQNLLWPTTASDS